MPTLGAPTRASTGAPGSTAGRRRSCLATSFSASNAGPPALVHAAVTASSPVATAAAASALVRALEAAAAASLPACRAERLPASTRASVFSYRPSPRVSVNKAASKGCRDDTGGNARVNAPTGVHRAWASASRRRAAAERARAASFFIFGSGRTRPARRTAVANASSPGGMTGRRENTLAGGARGRCVSAAAPAADARGGGAGRRPHGAPGQGEAHGARRRCGTHAQQKRGGKERKEEGV